jgi:sec-independent protein translocase protein TatA
VLNLGTPELLVIFLVALIVLGPTKLPEAARQLGKAMAQMRRMGAGFKAEMRDAMQEPHRPAPTNPVVGPEAPDTGEAGKQL